MSIFPREQFLILKSEELYAEPTAIVKQTLEFLNISVKEQKKEYKAFNEASYTPMQLKTRERLIEYFRPHNTRLYEFLGRDFGWDK